MRPKTFPATVYPGNSRQRLQVIRQGLKQPSKPSGQGLPEVAGNDSEIHPKIIGGKDAARQQQLRPTAKFGPYQKALREIRYSLLPFANESGISATTEVNKQMLQDLVNAGCDQEMAIRALKQTGSRSIEAALEYISKMGYLDPRNEQIVRVIKQTSPGKGMGPNNPTHRPSFEGSNESFPAYHHINNAAYDEGFAVDDDSVLGGDPRQYRDYLQAAAMNVPVQRISGPHNTPNSHQHQQKTYSANVESTIINYPVINHGGQALQLPGNHGSSSPHYGRRHMITQVEPMGQGIQRSPSFQNKIQQEGGYVNIQNKGTVQNNSSHVFQQAQASLYMPHAHHKQTSPPHQIHILTRGPPFASDFQEVSQNIVIPSRNSLNMDIFDIGNSQVQQRQTTPSRRDSLQNPGMETVPRQHVPFRPNVQLPSRTNSFNNHQQQMAVCMRQPPSNKPDPSITSSNTITAVTSAHILQPVKSMRVMRPEPQTAVGPTHPGWLAAQTQAPGDSEIIEQPSLPAGGASAFGLDIDYSTQEPRCPPPPYPKHLLLQNSSEQFEKNSLHIGVDQTFRGTNSTLCNKAEDISHDKAIKNAKSEKTGKDKKQIQTSPVPVRKNGRDEEKRESRIKSYSPFAFKFYMEQHVENVLKTYQQKINRRLQLEQEMAKAGLCESEQVQMRKILYQKESNYNRLKRAKMDKSMFVKIKTLGIGAFGEVCLSCKVDTNALYAMKTLRKKDVLNRNQVAHVKAERDILAEADNEWVVKLYYSFQDKDNLYFVMDYIPGGDMMSLLIRMDVFPQHLARFYIAELTMAIESVHKMGFIHRDIKPDNILIDLDGHIKLTDFGLCTGFRWTHNSKYYQKGNHIRQDSMEPSDLWDEVPNCRCGDRLKTLEQRAKRQHQRCLAHSLVGTPNYIAPEVLLRKGYTQLCDWWSVGVILFEMLVGQPPFLAATPTETQLKVINWESTLHIPSQNKLSPEARDLIIKLCCAAEDRLGINGIDDIKGHPFFDAIDFSSDIRRQPAPYIPKISHPMDTSNFDPVEEENPWNDSEDSTRTWDVLTCASSKNTEHAFYEFTFRRFFDDNGYPFRYPKTSEYENTHSDELPVENKDSVNHTEGCQPVYV
uniref:non-specific serine/threonine protein kinase n=1 Tax=Geotrypetes seraphini TaxID=260995 RepID=A0A6P8RA22_GEOSA|nr:serine/threonine-protein kinase LATS2 [Geotrypetes seraphini]XP_033805475.1 serine/threonine-protein kinase LATS2 [Geotrypetes seraphini]XP_033805476.1 serine/threonine-protein kinase LATS2 [Geotrypetes seraphini]XP_033805478.1 serine/threonine-protein kinase LATS2 [Geotrypetes seraphini]XP_033805479.1 serine/threonine-protein kinase LATS2 [Geotrypetes seraphini]XP_033805480.1 serine/threonine-protein kinase LATS2 [Geotrypetes seraphini]